MTRQHLLARFFFDRWWENPSRLQLSVPGTPEGDLQLREMRAMMH